MRFIDSFLNYLVTDIVSTVDIKFPFLGAEQDRQGLSMAKDKLCGSKRMRYFFFKRMCYPRSFCKKSELPHLKIPKIDLVKFFPWGDGLPDINIKLNPIGDVAFEIMRVDFLC